MKARSGEEGKRLCVCVWKKAMYVRGYTLYTRCGMKGAQIYSDISQF